MFTISSLANVIHAFPEEFLNQVVESQVPPTNAANSAQSVEDVLASSYPDYEIKPSQHRTVGGLSIGFGVFTKVAFKKADLAFVVRTHALVDTK